MTATLRRPRQRSGGQAGFTLIELLVVIVILGILSGVVVFAVRGAGDKGKGAAVATDERTIRTAQEVYCAKAGRYGTMRQLTGEDPVDPVNDPDTYYKFLSEPSKYHDVSLVSPDQGNCPGGVPKYGLVCLDGNVFPNCSGAEAPVTRPKWIQSGDLPTTMPDRALMDAVVALAGTGRIVNAGGPNSIFATIIDGRPFVPWQYEDRKWTEKTAQLAAYSTSVAYAAAIPGQPSEECPLYCGKVLVKMDVGAGDQQPRDGLVVQWVLYDPELDTLTALPPSRDRCYADYGVLVTLGDGRIMRAGCGGAYSSQATRQKSEIFNPKVPAGGYPWVSVDDSLYKHSKPIAVRLRDNRVLVVGDLGDTGENAEIYDPSTGKWSDAADPPGLPLGSSHAGSVLLGDGRVLLMAKQGGQFLLYTPDSGVGLGSWTKAPKCECGLDDAQEISRSSVTLLASGRVLVTGGQVGPEYNDHTDAAAMFDPRGDKWIPVDNMPIPRSSSHSHLLVGTKHCPGPDCNKVLLTGGEGVVYPGPYSTSILFSEDGKD